jgi:hypothetical protein
VVCPDQIIYRYRQHSSSISRSQRGRQHECFVEMRREYQAECLERSLDADLSIELSRFWNREGKRPYAVDVKRAHAVLIELQGSFLEYIQRRYGAEESTKLRVDLDAALGSRLGYWLYRSAWFADRRACSEILALAGDKQHAFGVARKAAGHAAAAVLRKLRPASGRSGDSPE